MTPPARPAPEAFRRGLSAVVANPGLILAPLAFAAMAFGAIAVPVFLLILGLGGISSRVPADLGFRAGRRRRSCRGSGASSRI